MDELLNGLTLWDEHKPQSGQDWIGVAERTLAADALSPNASPIFAGLVGAVQQRDAAASQRDQAIEALRELADEMQELSERAEGLRPASSRLATSDALHRGEAAAYREAAFLARQALARLQPGEPRAWSDNEVRLVAMSAEQHRRLDALLRDPDKITGGLDRLAFVGLACSWENGITEEELTTWENRWRAKASRTVVHRARGRQAELLQSFARKVDAAFSPTEDTDGSAAA